MEGKPGYVDGGSKQAIAKRLARVEGQIRGIARMVEEDRYCIDVLTQIQAAEAALHGVALSLLDDHVRHCMTADPSEEKAEELMAAVSRFSRG